MVESHSPGNSSVRYETDRIDARGVVRFLVGLGLGLALTHFAAWGLWRYCTEREKQVKSSAYIASSPPADHLPPPPRLEALERHVDGSILRSGPPNVPPSISIEDAMKALVEKLPARRAGPGNNSLPGESSSGRSKPRNVNE